MNERAISHVPAPARALLALALALQLGWQALVQPTAPARPEDLPLPPATSSLRLASFGDPVALARLLTLYLQSFDAQGDRSIAWRQLDYPRVQAWLAASLALDPRGQTPMLLASRVYGEVTGDEARQRQMLAFVRQQFEADPNRRYPWLAHASVLARHRLKDLPLAREYAQAMRLQATGPEVPHWARQMEILLLEDMNELDMARVLLGALISSGQVKEENELRFLRERLVEVEEKMSGARSSAGGTP